MAEDWHGLLLYFAVPAHFLACLFNGGSLEALLSCSFFLFFALVPACADRYKYGLKESSVLSLFLIIVALSS